MELLRNLCIILKSKSVVDAQISTIRRLHLLLLLVLLVCWSELNHFALAFPSYF